jgi:hypothetical protein
MHFEWRTINECTQDEQKQLVISHEIFRMHIYRIPSEDHVLVCGQ